MAGDTRQRMLEATARLVRERGYSGTSLNDILAASGAPRGSLYHHFPGGKDELIAEVTLASIEQVSSALTIVMQEENSPTQAVRRIFASTADLLRDSDFASGCPVAPIVLDGTGDIPALARISQEAFSTWVGIIANGFERAGIPPNRAHSLAMLVESTIEGLMVIARATADARPFEKVVEELGLLLDAAVTDQKEGQSRRSAN